MQIRGSMTDLVKASFLKFTLTMAVNLKRVLKTKFYGNYLIKKRGGLYIINTLTEQ